MKHYYHNTSADNPHNTVLCYITNFGDIATHKGNLSEIEEIIATVWAAIGGEGCTFEQIMENAARGARKKYQHLLLVPLRVANGDYT